MRHVKHFFFIFLLVHVTFLVGLLIIGLVGRILDRYGTGGLLVLIVEFLATMVGIGYALDNTDRP